MKEATMHTPESWVKMFNETTPENQLAIAAHVIENAETVTRCFMEDHQGAVQFRALHHCQGTE